MAVKVRHHADGGVTLTLGAREKAAALRELEVTETIVGGVVSLIEKALKTPVNDAPKPTVEA